MPQAIASRPRAIFTPWGRLTGSFPVPNCHDHKSHPKEEAWGAETCRCEQDGLSCTQAPAALLSPEQGEQDGKC